MSLFVEFGGTKFPLTAGDVTDGQLVSSLDPGGDVLRELFRSALNAELSPVWDVVVPTVDRLSGRSVVHSIFHEAPRAGILKEVNKLDPCLFVYRTSAVHNEKYIQFGEIVTQWGLDYILGPTKVEDYRKIGPIFAGVEKVINWVVRRGGHSSYQSGKLVFLDDDSPFSRVRVINSQMGVADFGQEGQGVEIRALHMNLETTELERETTDSIDENTAIDEYEGVNYTIELEPD